MKDATRGRSFNRILSIAIALLAMAAGPFAPGAGRAAAQDEAGDERAVLGISAQNQTEYSRSNDGDLEILLEWFDVAATYGDYRGGFRYEAFQPPRPGDPLGEAIRGGFPFRYIETTQRVGTIRAGNYYALFGRGLALNLFENRDVRIDTNLDGVKYQGAWRSVALTALSGRARVNTTQRWLPQTGGLATSSFVERNDVVHAADLSIHPVPALRMSGSLVTDRYPSGGADVTRTMRAARTEVWTGPLAFYGEVSKVQNPADAAHGTGDARYGSVTVSGPGFGFLAEAKDYRHFAFNTAEGDVYLNSPPAGTRDHAYTLLNRHPHTLNVGDERGYQLEASVTPSPGISATLNHSHTENHAGQRLYREFYGEVRDDESFGRVFSLIGAADYLHDRFTKDLTLIGEGTIQVTDDVTARLEFGNQHVTDERQPAGGAGTVGEYDDRLAVLEVSRSPEITAGFTVEWNNKSPEQRAVDQETDRSWAQANLSLQLIENTNLEIAYGSRQAGYYCVGGRCRYEPAFKGLGLKLLAQF